MINFCPDDLGFGDACFLSKGRLAGNPPTSIFCLRSAIIWLRIIGLTLKATLCGPNDLNLLVILVSRRVRKNPLMIFLPLLSSLDVLLVTMASIDFGNACF